MDVLMTVTYVNTCLEMNSQSEFIETTRPNGLYLLSCAIKSAWEKCHARRIWVCTCTSDHPNALGNYQPCGLKICHKDSFTEQYWPGIAVLSTIRVRANGRDATGRS